MKCDYCGGDFESEDMQQNTLSNEYGCPECVEEYIRDLFVDVLPECTVCGEPNDGDTDVCDNCQDLGDE